MTELTDPPSSPGTDVTESLIPSATAAPPSVSGNGYAVETTGLTKRYGTLNAVDELDLKIPTGSIYGLIGPNGAGKSTTFSMIATLLRPTSGSISVLGYDPGKSPRDVRRQLGYMPDVLGVYDNLRVDEYLQFFAASYRVPRKEWPSLIDGLLELVDLNVKSTSLVNSLSRGMKQRLSLARTLVHDPNLLVLDEPASGLDPRARVELRDTLRQLNQMGKTIIVSSHILAELEEMCTEVAIMEAGKLLASGSPRRIMDQLGRAKSVSVRFTDGATETFTVADDDAQVALLRRLALDEERGVLEFREEHYGLEELFMSITEGIVQ